MHRGPGAALCYLSITSAFPMSSVGRRIQERRDPMGCSSLGIKWLLTVHNPKPGQCLDVCRHQWTRSTTWSKWGIANIQYNKRRNPDHQPSLTSRQVKSTATHLQRARSGFGWHPTWYWFSGFNLCSREHIAPCQANVIAPWTDPVILCPVLILLTPCPPPRDKELGKCIIFHFASICMLMLANATWRKRICAWEQAVPDFSVVERGGPSLSCPFSKSTKVDHLRGKNNWVTSWIRKMLLEIATFLADQNKRD